MPFCGYLFVSWTVYFLCFLCYLFAYVKLSIKNLLTYLLLKMSEGDTISNVAVQIAAKLTLLYPWWCQLSLASNILLTPLSSKSPTDPSAIKLLLSGLHNPNIFVPIHQFHFLKLKTYLFLQSYPSWTDILEFDSAWYISFTLFSIPTFHSSAHHSLLTFILSKISTKCIGISFKYMVHFK